MSRENQERIYFSVLHSPLGPTRLTLAISIAPFVEKRCFNASLSRLRRRVFNQAAERARLCLPGDRKGPSADRRSTTSDRKGEREREREREGGDANSAFNKVSRGCHLNIVAYSLFSSSPRAEETEASQRDEKGGRTGEGEDGG